MEEVEILRKELDAKRTEITDLRNLVNKKVDEYSEIWERLFQALKKTNTVYIIHDIKNNQIDIYRNEDAAYEYAIAHNLKYEKKMIFEYWGMGKPEKYRE